MSSKILLRRGTAAQWSSANPILGNGELGIETDTLKIKIGNGTSTWSQLTSYANVTPSQLTSEINSLINAAPSTLDTLNELAAAINNDASFSTTVNNLLTGKVSKSGGDTITSATASTKGLVIKGASSQTASLLEWQDSSGNLLGRFHPTAGLLIPGLSNTNGGAAPYINFNTTNFVLYPNLASNVGLIIQGAASQTANLQEWKNSAGTVLAYIASNGYFNTVASLGVTGQLNVYSGASIVSPNTTSSSLTLKGVASQTANLQEWQTSSGLVLANVSSNGGFNSIGESSFGYSSYTDPLYGISSAVKIGGGTATTQLGIKTSSASGIGIIVRASSSQTGDLQQWQNSSGSVLTSVDKDGYLQTPRLVITNGGNIIDSAGTTPYFGFGSNQIAIYTRNAAYKGLVVQGTTSQSANLQEWQDSSGTVLAGIGQNGRIFAQGKSGNTDDLLYLRRADNNISLYVDKDATLRGNFNIRLNQEPTIDTQAFIWSGTPSRSAFGLSGTGSTNPTFYVKANSSQTSSLTEWQNSSGSVLSYVDSAGNINFSGTGSFAQASTGRALFVVNGTTNIPIIAKAASGQTANLQEWQNSSGTALAYIGNDGNFNNQSSFASVLTTSVAASGGNITTTYGLYSNLPASTNAGVAVKPWAANITGSIIRGYPSQTADLQQWQNSSASILGKVNSVGAFSAKSFKASGYATTATGGGTWINYWHKMADITLPSQFSDAQTVIDFNISGPGFTYTSRGRLFVRVKQQNALGSAPETPTIVVYNGENVVASNFALVVVQNNSSATVYELYHRIPTDWAGLIFWPTADAGNINYYDQATPIASLPSGTVTYASFPSETFVNLTANSFIKSGGTSSQFLKADGSIDSTSYISPSSSYVAGHHPEGRYLASAALMNDLGNARLRGSTFTFTNISPANSEIDKLFDGTAQFLAINPVGQTYPVVIEFTLPRTLSWGSYVGIGFGNAEWRTNSVKIEAFSQGAWVTCIDTTTNTSEDILVGIPNNAGTGTTKLRYTLSNPNNATSIRICHLWAFNYNSEMWTQLQMPRAGGTMYGALNTKGAISVLDSSNTTTIALNQDGSGSIAKTDPYGGVTWNSYGNISVRTAGSSGGYNGFVNIGSATQASSTPALVLRGHIEPNSLTNSSPLQVWQKADGVLLAKIDQFGAFTVNVNSASSIPLILKGASSQTANLQEWQNSSGTVLAKVTSAGALDVTGITVNGAAITTPAATVTTLGTVYGRTDDDSNLVNTVIGYKSLPSPSSAAGNVAIGDYVLYNNTNSNNNTGVGSGALLFQTSTTGFNTAIGARALRSLTTGGYNTAIGYNAGVYSVALTTGSNNTIIGSQASASSASVSNEITIGNDQITAFRIPGLNIDWNGTTSGLIYGLTEKDKSYGNVFLGQNAGQTSFAGNGDTFIGDKSGVGVSNGSNGQNTAVGNYSLYSINGGKRNVAIGWDSMYYTNAGEQNVAIGGEDTLYSNQTGNWNVVVGSLAAYNLNSSYNTVVGGWAGYTTSSGQYNTLLGYRAGYNGTTGLTTGSNNIIIGNTAMPSAVTVSNEITLGNSNITRFRVPGLSIDWNKDIEIMSIMGAY